MLITKVIVTLIAPENIKDPSLLIKEFDFKGLHSKPDEHLFKIFPGGWVRIFNAPTSSHIFYPPHRIHNIESINKK